MTLKFTTTDQASLTNGVKIAVYGQSGVGKTVLCSTAPNPFLISAEGGELSLRRVSMPMVKISTVEDLTDIYAWCLNSKESTQFETICLDSLSDIAETVLANSKKTVKDPRMAYADLLEHMTKLIKFFRDLPNRHVYMSVKQEAIKDAMTGCVQYGPSMPGARLGPMLPYFFDIVLRLGVNKAQDGTDYRFLQAQPDFQYQAKDRSGSLAQIEPPNLTHIFNKILGK